MTYKILICTPLVRGPIEVGECLTRKAAEESADWFRTKGYDTKIVKDGDGSGDPPQSR